MTIAHRKPVAILALALALGAFTALPARAAGSAAESQVAARALSNPVVRLINGIRRQHGLPALTVSKQLAAAAISHARSMGRYGFFSHTSRDGTPPGARIQRFYHGSAFGEALVWRAPDLTPEEAVQIWMASAPHRAVLLSSTMTQIGLGAVRVTDGSGVYHGNNATILVADLGRP
jgi:uncharacterized protein YkwD